MKRGESFALFAAVIFIAVAQAFFVALYIGFEHTIYFWDHAMYADMAQQFYLLCGQSLADAWASFKSALAGNYNLIYALPALIGFYLFGAARITFILTNFFVFFLAFEFAFAFLLRRALDLSWGNALIISFACASLVPLLWLPLLEGYPDVGAAACIVFAAALMLKGPGTQHLIRRGLGAGIILGLAVLLRRHFAYAVLTLAASTLCLTLWDIRQARRKERPRAIFQAPVYFVSCGLGCIGIIGLIAPDFLYAVLTTDYGALYLSYKKPVLVFLYFVLGGFGYGLLLIAASGLVVLSRAGTAGRRLAAFTVLYVFIWLVIWCGGADQIGDHYMLQVLPFGILVGLAGWALFLAGARQMKYVLGGAVFLLLFVNSAWALWFAPKGVWPNDNGTPGVFSAPRPPVIRADYDEWLRLARYLQDTTKPDDSVMVVGSSFVFNLDLLHSVYNDIIGAPDMVSRFPKTPEIDHEEPSPLDIFAAADVYVVPTPAQYHLEPAGQRVVTAAANRFPPAPVLASLFQSDDAFFHFAKGVAVKIWRRAPWTPGLLHEALAEIRHDAPQDPNFAQDWVTETIPRAAQIRTDNNKRSWVDGIFDPSHPDMKLFFDYPLAPGTYSLDFSIASACAGPRMSFEIVDTDGRAGGAKDLELAPDGRVSGNFTVPEKPGADHFLTLALTLTPATLCRADLIGLQVEREP